MRAIFVVFAVVSLFPVATNLAQSQRQEFIESSSPLPGGGQVTSRSTPGQQMQTVAVSPSTPLGSSENSVLNQSNDKVVRPTSQRNSVFRQSPLVQNNSAVVPRYSYPAGNFLPRQRNSQTALFYQPVRASATCTNCAVPYQIPTLGLTNTVQTARQSYAQGNCCSPVTGTNTVLQVPAAQVPTLQIQPPANQIPTLAAPTNQQVFQTAPNLGVPQFNTQQNRFLNPFVTGSGAYQPIIRIANVPPGTYVGQGIIGQPVAYVDGQPVRNLLRYVFP